jgi:hypothetical protein
VREKGCWRRQDKEREGKIAKEKEKGVGEGQRKKGKWKIVEEM